MAVSIVLVGPTQYLDHTSLNPYQPQSTLKIVALPRAADSGLYAAYAPNATFSAPDTLVQNANTGSQNLSVWKVTTPAKGYQPTVTASAITDFATAQVTLRDGTSNVLYVAPYLEEGPMADNRLMFRYKLFRHFTVLNNSGVFTAVRYQSTDQINAATQVFTNDAVVASSDRTNILNAGIGGEFRASA